MIDNLLLKALLLFLVAFIGYMHSYWGSTMHNRPLIMATLVGALLGDVKTGIMIGTTLELAFLGAVPIGASNPPDMTSGAIIATAFTILYGASAGVAVIIAIPVAKLVSLFDNFQMMHLLTKIAHVCDAAAELADVRKIEKIVVIASVGNKMILALLVAICFCLSSFIIEPFINFLPQWVIHGMDIVAKIVPALSIATLARMIISKDNWAYLGLGFLFSAYLGISTLKVGLVGVFIAGFVFYKESKKMEVNVDDNEF